jgi:hypothetical protein
MPSKPRKPIADLIGELQSWLPNYDHGPENFPTLFWRILASVPGGDRAADMGYETFNLGWKEVELLGSTLEAIQDTRDVEDLINGLVDEEEEEVAVPPRHPRAHEAPPRRPVGVRAKRGPKRAPPPRRRGR